jgi:RNA-binding protein YlmH
VKPTIDEHLVVVNYHSATPDAAGLRARHLISLRDFGHGVLLCRNETR